MRGIAGLATAVAVLIAAPASAQQDVVGRWATPGLSAVVELGPCAGAATLCGTIRWLWDGRDDKGRPRLDVHNGDAALRSRPLLGLSILSGLSPSPDGGWSGHIYNPEDGETYRAKMHRVGADTLVIEGCVLFVCKKQVWRKASSLAEALR